MKFVICVPLAGDSEVSHQKRRNLQKMKSSHSTSTSTSFPFSCWSWIIAFKTTRQREMKKKMKNTIEKLQVTKRLFCTWLCKLETLIRVEIFPPFTHTYIQLSSSTVFWGDFNFFSSSSFSSTTTTSCVTWVLEVSMWKKGYWASGDCYLVHEI